MVDFPEPEGIGRNPVLDTAKRNRIIAMLVNGSSRRMAAAYVGCAPSTITRTILRDPQFAMEISQAEQTSEIQALRAIRKAYQEPRYWRAAAWLLERRNPNDFTVRKPNILTEEAAKDAIDVFIKVAMEEVTDRKQYRRMMERVSEVLGLPPMDADELRDLNDIYSEEEDTPAQPPPKPSKASRPNSSAMPDDEDDDAGDEDDDYFDDDEEDDDDYDDDDDDDNDDEDPSDGGDAPRAGGAKAPSPAPFATVDEFPPSDFGRRSNVQPLNPQSVPSSQRNVNETQHAKGRCTWPEDYATADAHGPSPMPTDARAHAPRVAESNAHSPAPHATGEECPPRNVSQRSEVQPPASQPSQSVASSRAYVNKFVNKRELKRGRSPWWPEDYAADETYVRMPDNYPDLAPRDGESNACSPDPFATLDEITPDDIRRWTAMQSLNQQQVPSTDIDATPTQHSEGRCKTPTNSEVPRAPDSTASTAVPDEWSPRAPETPPPKP